MNRRIVPLMVGLLFVGFSTGPAQAMDWGLGVEESTSVSTVLGNEKSGAVKQGGILSFWSKWAFGRDASLLLKIKGDGTLRYGLEAGNPLSLTMDPELDTMVFTTSSFQVGRTDFRDFSATLLNTKLDGLQWTLTAPGIETTALIGTSAGIFKANSTIVISQADLADRVVTPDWRKPETLFAPPRLVGYLETAFPQVDSDLIWRIAVLGQYDLRAKQATDGAAHNPTDPKAPGAAVSMGYAGASGEGRIAGPLYWGAWVYGGLGTTATPVGTYVKAKTNPTPQPAQYQTWKPATIVNGIASLNLNLLLPEWQYSVLDLQVVAGTWDPDGVSPDLNAASGSSPTLYTGYFGVSRTGGSLIFNPQPANMATVRLLYSIKPFAGSRGWGESLQLVTSAFAFVRPTTGAISEAGLDSRSHDLYIASELDLNLLWRPASEWGASFGCGLLVPNQKALTRTNELKVQAGLNLSL